MFVPRCCGFALRSVLFLGAAVALVLFADSPAIAQKKHAAEGKARSIKSDIPTSIEFFNRGQEVIKVFWLNLEGKRELKGTLNPGDRQTMQTFLNHAWVLTDANDNALGLYYPDADARLITHGLPKGFGFAKGKGGGFGKGNPPGGFGKAGFGKGKKGGPSVAPRIAYVLDARSAGELKLTQDQIAKAKILEAIQQAELQALPLQGMSALQRSRKTAEIKAELDRGVANLLNPAQNKRLEQLQRQDLGADLFLDKTLIDALQLTLEQRTKLVPIRTKFNGERLDALRSDPTAGPDFVKKLGQSRKTAFEAATALLNADQKTIWEELVGAPWSGFAPGSPVTSQAGFPAGGRGGSLRSRAFDFNNWTATNGRFLTEKSVQDALKLTNDQIQQIGGKVLSAANVLTPAQLKQYQGIYLQQSMTAYGPAGKFRYREVLDLMNLTEAQKARILAVGREDAQAFASLGAARNPADVQKLDKATIAKLDDVLTPEQRTKLKDLVGEPFRGVIQNPFGTPAFTKSERPPVGDFGKGGKKR